MMGEDSHDPWLLLDEMDRVEFPDGTIYFSKLSEGTITPTSNPLYDLAKMDSP